MLVIRILTNGWCDGRIGAVRPRPIRSLVRRVRDEGGSWREEGFGVIVKRKPLR